MRGAYRFCGFIISCHWSHRKCGTDRWSQISSLLLTVPDCRFQLISTTCDCLSTFTENKLLKDQIYRWTHPYVFGGAMSRNPWTYPWKIGSFSEKNPFPVARMCTAFGIISSVSVCTCDPGRHRCYQPLFGLLGSLPTKWTFQYIYINNMHNIYT